MVFTGADLSAMTFDDLQNDPRFYFHHSASQKGYVSRKGDGFPTLYSGKFGSGIVWHLPSYVSSNYHVVMYFIFNEE